MGNCKHEDKTRRTVVRWELDATPHGTHVKVTHTGLAKEPAARKDYGSGWLGVLEMLQMFSRSTKMTPMPIP
jgi:hypothetical protein